MVFESTPGLEGLVSVSAQFRLHGSNRWLHVPVTVDSGAAWNVLEGRLLKSFDFKPEDLQPVSVSFGGVFEKDGAALPMEIAFADAPECVVRSRVAFVSGAENVLGVSFFQKLLDFQIRYRDGEVELRCGDRFIPYTELPFAGRPRAKERL